MIRGTLVNVITGDYKGRTGKIAKIDKKKKVVFLDGFKIANHSKKTKKDKFIKFHISNLREIKSEG